MILISLTTVGQDWEFVKEKDGIRVYLADEPGQAVKAYRGETILKATADEILDLLIDINNYKIWDESIYELELIEKQDENSFKYYMAYNVPWPFEDRDICVEVTVINDPAKSEYKVSSKSVPELIPGKEGRVRITDYWQHWSVVPLEEGKARVISEGFADPAGNTPAWLNNMVITDSPLKTLRKIREQLE